MAEEVTNETPEEGAETLEPDAASQPEAQAAPKPTAEAGPAAEPAEAVAPKERRRRARTAKSARGPVRAPRTPEERHEERLAERRRKAAVRRLRRQRERANARASRTAPATTPPREHEPGKQKTRQGVVVSDRAEKTITVRIDVTRRHPRYAKVVRTSSTLHAHDELGDAHIGDTVIVRESRPLSRTKRWRLVEVVERAK
ncbi:MAG: 30S ribosomal protein S17 [Solirubrobacterales bacterium]|nr:30S ribosomal protein S17 [Solirubrobacterales bacterium]